MSGETPNARAQAAQAVLDAFDAAGRRMGEQMAPLVEAFIRIGREWTPGRVLAEGMAEHNRRMAEINRR